MSHALEAAWTATWADFLSNRIGLAERRAAPFLHSLPALLDNAAAAAAPTDDVGEDSQVADTLVTLADMAHIAGAVRGDSALLKQALAAYEEHLRRVPGNAAALRMRAETLLRLGDYAAAFAAFDTLHEAAVADPDAEQHLEVAPFQLIHDAECVEDAVRLGADASELAAAAGWRSLAETLTQAAGGDATVRTPLVQLDAAQRSLLGWHGRRPLPVPPTIAACGEHASPSVEACARALRSSIDWAHVSREYEERRAVVIDDLLDPAALQTLQAYSRHGANFRTLRKGYLGAFPADGTTHPVVRRLTEELVAAAPSIFGNHALALWWIFKYDQTNPAGIGIHADPAAVNINLWLTDDAACLDGGGLAIYSHVPSLEQPTSAVNKEYDSEATEASLRQSLVSAGQVRTIPYRCNRAAVFVSDQYHESLPFRFAAGYEHRRANLTLLFGDRWRPLEGHPAGNGASASGADHASPADVASAADGAGEDQRAGRGGGPAGPSSAGGWDVFD